MSSEKYDYLIVGAGLFGATFASAMTKRGKRCLVVEKRERVGGNIATEVQDGIIVHKFGAHIFHTDDKAAWDYVNTFVEFDSFINSPIANYRGKLYSLPFNMYTFNQLWGCKTPAEAKAIIGEQVKPYLCAEPKNIEEKALSTVGEDVYNILIKGYTQKQWGRDCKTLPPFIIGRLPLRFTFNNNYFNDAYQGIPRGGYSAMVENMLKGSDVLLGVDYFADRENLTAKAKTTLYTGAIDRFFDYKFGALEYRSLRFETETLDTDNYQGNAVVNYTDYDVPYTRIIEHRHFDKTCSSDKTVITREYPSAYTAGGEPYYPINDSKNNELYEKYRALAETAPQVIMGGRLACYKYYDMDDTVAEALSLAAAQK